MFADLFLHQHIFWHTQWDFINKIDMATSDLYTDNVIGVTEADHREEEKQAMERDMEEYRQLCLKSFSVNRSGEVIKKQDLMLPQQVTFDPNPGNLQDMVNIIVNHALINHSNVLSNTVYWSKLLKKDRHHHFMLAQPIISQDYHRLWLHWLLQPLQVQRLLLLQT